MPAADPFFDTNVLLYLLSGNEAKAERTEALLQSGGVISVQVLNEVASVALGKKAVNFREVREILAILRAVRTVQWTSKRMSAVWMSPNAIISRSTTV